MSEQEPKLHTVVMTICDLCLDGAGGECHTPGCALWINRAPDLPLRNHPMVSHVDGWPLCQRCHDRRAVLHVGGRRDRHAFCHECLPTVESVG